MIFLIRDESCEFFGSALKPYRAQNVFIPYHKLSNFLALEHSNFSSRGLIP